MVEADILEGEEMGFFLEVEYGGIEGFIHVTRGLEAPVTGLLLDRTDMPSHLLSLEKKLKIILRKNPQANRTYNTLLLNSF